MVSNNQQGSPGYTPPQLGAYTMKNFTPWQEGIVIQGGVDFEYREPSMFEGLTTDIQGALNNWQALNENLLKIKQDRLQMKYDESEKTRKNTLQTWSLGPGFYNNLRGYTVPHQRRPGDI